MLFSSALLQQIVLLCSILLAIVLGLLYLHWRSHLQSLRSISVPLLGFAIFGICDALLTLHGTWQSPWREANPSMRVFLLWGGWWGQCLGSALWILAWTLVLDRMESWRAGGSIRTACLASGLRLWVVYGLAIGHLNGFVSWLAPSNDVARIFAAFRRLWVTQAAWLAAISPFGYPLYSGLCFGSVCALAHVLIVWGYERGQAANTSSANL